MKPFTLIIITFLGLISVSTSGQINIDVTEQTIKIGGIQEEVMFFGFAEGDQIHFSFTELDGKELKEIEILEYPSVSKFADYKTAKIENKVINVPKTAIYQFRFYNSAIGGRICQIKIQRTPANEQTKNFNTGVTWITKQDTTWNTYTKDVIVGYDTTYEQKIKRELIKTERKEESIFEKKEKVHSQTNENGNKTYVFFSLPQNKQSDFQTTKVISWAYWVGVGNEANEAWKQNMQAISGLATGTAEIFLTPLGALAVGAVANLMAPSTGEDVAYWVSDQANKDLFMADQQFRIWDKGKGVTGFKKFTDPGMCQGTFFILLSNDNEFLGINADVKVSAIIETKTYADIPYTEQKTIPRYEKRIFKDPLITATQVPVLGK